MNPQHQQALYHFADMYGVPRNVAFALVRQESGGNPSARSPVGAEGYTQLMPGTAKGLGVNPLDPIDNLRGGMMYLGHLMKSFNGNVRLALAAYNAGPAAVRRYGGIPPYAETQNYVRAIMGMAGPGQRNGPMAQSRLKAINANVGSNTIGPTSPLMNHLINSLPTSGEQDILSRLGGTAAKTSAAMAAQGSALFGAGLGSQTQPGQINVPRIEVQGKMTKRDAQAAALIKESLGTPYVWGGSKPGGFDCSGLLQYYWGKVGVNIPRTTYDQWKAGQAVGRGQLRVGDAVFFRGSDARGNLPGHVGFYIGGGKFIEAPHTGAKVRIATLKGRSDFVGARRFA